MKGFSSKPNLSPIKHLAGGLWKCLYSMLASHLLVLDGKCPTGISSSGGRTTELCWSLVVPSGLKISEEGLRGGSAWISCSNTWRQELVLSLLLVCLQKRISNSVLLRSVNFSCLNRTQLRFMYKFRIPWGFGYFRLTRFEMTWKGVAGSCDEGLREAFACQGK